MASPTPPPSSYPGRSSSVVNGASTSAAAKRPSSSASTPKPNGNTDSPRPASPAESNRNDEEEEEEEEEDILDDIVGDEDRDKILREKVLVGAFDEEQRERLFAWRTSGIPKPIFKRFVNHTLQQSVGDPVAISFMGISKVFVGQIVQLGLKVQRERGESGPLSPDHLREAWRRYQQDRHRPTAGGKRKSLFVR